MKKTLVCFLLLLAAAWHGCGGGSPERLTVLRVGYFPNITHIQPLVGLADAHNGFRKSLAPEINVTTHVFNAGPSAIEALFAGEIDLTYIGPNPAVNGYVRSGGKAVRIIAGAMSGGAVLVARPGVRISSPADWAGKRVATPQLGNTQDVALRAYLLEHHLNSVEKGGNVTVIPMQNPDIMTVFLKGEIDGAWVPEPWGARLLKEGGGTIVVDERDLWPEGRFVTACLIVRTRFLEEHPDVVARWLEAHVEITDWIIAHPDDAKRIANEEIRRLTTKALSPEILDDAWSRLNPSYEPMRSSLIVSAERAFALGYLGREKPDLANIYDLRLLNQVLQRRGVQAVK